MFFWFLDAVELEEPRTEGHGIWPHITTRPQFPREEATRQLLPVLSPKPREADGGDTGREKEVLPQSLARGPVSLPSTYAVSAPSTSRPGSSEVLLAFSSLPSIALDDVMPKVCPPTFPKT